MSKTDDKELEEAIENLKGIQETNRAWLNITEENKKMEIEIANHVYWESTPVNEIKKMYIPKDKIREKIEELEKEKEELENKTFLRIIDYINEKEKIDNQIKVLEELLKEE